MGQSFAIHLVGLIFAQEASEEISSLNLRRGATDISGQVYDLHMLMFFICVGIAVVVFGVMFASMYLHRKSRGAKPANFHENVKVEIAWTVIPFLILVFMACWSLGRNGSGITNIWTVTWSSTRFLPHKESRLKTSFRKPITTYLRLTVH